PYQPLTEKSLMPPSAAVGTSGRPGARFSAAIDSGFRRPLFAYGVTMEITDHMYGRWPATTSAAPGPLPLYGRYWIFIPARCRNSSPARKPALPGSVAYERLACRSFAHAMNSASELAGIDGFTTSTVGS